MAGRKSVITGAAIAGFALLNIAGIAAIAGGTSAGSPDSSPQVQSDARFDALSENAENVENAPDSVTPPQDTNVPVSGSAGSEDTVSPAETSAEEREARPGRGPRSGAGLVGAGGPLDDKDARELRALVSAASLSISEAEEAATGEVSGAVLESDLDSDDDAPVYEIKVFADDGNLYEFKVDATDGKVMESEIKASREARDAQFLLEDAEFDRDRARSIATDEIPGTVVENKLVNDAGSPAYEIEVIGDDGLYEIFVDAASGEVYSENKD